MSTIRMFDIEDIFNEYVDGLLLSNNRPQEIQILAYHGKEQVGFLYLAPDQLNNIGERLQGTFEITSDKRSGWDFEIRMERKHVRED